MVATLPAEWPQHDASETPLEKDGAPAIGVLHVINGEFYSGAERVQDLLAGHLPQYGYRVGLACVKPGLFPKLRKSREAPLYESPMRAKLDPRPIRDLVRWVRQEPYHLLHAHTPRTAALASVVSALTGVPLVYHLHSPAARDSTRFWHNRLNALVERVSLLRACAVIAVSRSLADEVLARGWRPDRVHVVANGVPRRGPRPARPAMAAEWILGTVALFRPRKGIEVLLSALAMLRAQGMPVRLRAVGAFETPQYEREVKHHARQLGLDAAVDWTGFTADVDAQLDQMDLFVLPSLFGEGLPMVVLEAMAAGVPVVASRVEGVPEVIDHEVEGLLVEPGDPAALVKAIARVIRGEPSWSTLQANARHRQASRFSEESMAAGVAEVYRRVLASRPARRTSRQTRRSACQSRAV